MRLRPLRCSTARPQYTLTLFFDPGSVLSRACACPPRSGPPLTAFFFPPDPKDQGRETRIGIGGGPLCIQTGNRGGMNCAARHAPPGANSTRANAAPPRIRALAEHLLDAPLLRAAQRIGGYAAVASEMSLQSAIEQAQARGQQIYLPHVEHTAPEMRFAHWSGQHKRLLTNRFGIPEPLVDGRSGTSAIAGYHPAAAGGL